MKARESPISACVTRHGHIPDRLCPLCDCYTLMYYLTDGDFEDYHEYCSNNNCAYNRWVDGIDS